MNPGLVIKLRPAGPWRIGPDSGARNKVDAIYHSDSLYAAVTSAMARFGALDEWLDATARSAAPAVCFSSAFPFLDEIGFVPPPRTVWPPPFAVVQSARVRWKSARFVPLGIVQAILSGHRLDDRQWAVDGPSECLVPVGRLGPFRTGVRWSAAVDRLSGASERHSTACLEFRPGAGLWMVVSFADEAGRDRWIEPVKAAFRLLADSGFGGERSRGWGRAETPEFVEGALPEMILGVGAAGPGPSTGAGEVPAAALPVEARGEEPAAGAGDQSSESGEVPAAAVPVEAGGEEPAAGTGDQASESGEVPAAAVPVEAGGEEPAAGTGDEASESGEVPAAAAPVEAGGEEPAAGAGDQASESGEVPAAAVPVEAGGEEPAAGAGDEASESGEVPAAAATVEAGGEEPSPVPPVEEPPAEEPPVTEPEPPELPAESSATNQVASPPAEELPDQTAAVRAIPEIEALAVGPADADEPPEPERSAEAEAHETSAEPVPPPPSRPAAVPGARAHWLLSLFTPAADDTVDWGRGNYTLLTRSGRVDRSGELKKQLPMVAEGSVVYAAAAPRGSAPDVAPEGCPHPVFRAGFALSIPLPEVLG